MKRKTLFLGAFFCFFSLALQAQWATSYTNSSGTRNYCDAKFITTTVGYVLAQEGEVLKTTDGGATWTVKTPVPGTTAAGAGSPKTMASFDFISETTGFVVGQNGLIYKTTDGALTWSAAISIGVGSTTGQNPITRYLNSIRFYDSNTGFILGNLGTVIKTTDGGTTWNRIINEPTSATGFPNTSSHYYFGSIIDATTLRIAPAFYTMGLLSGTTLTAATNITTNSTYYGAYFFDANNGYVVGYRGNNTYADILKTTDGGTTWTQTINTGANNTTAGTTLRSVTFTDTNNGIAVGLLGSVYETSDAGNSWTKNNNALFTGAGALLNVSKLANGHKFIVGVNKIFRYSIPVITGTATASAFTTTYGTASGAQTFSVSGSYLTANLVANAPTGFEVSSDGTNYGSTATFTPSSGSASGTLSIRLKADAAVSGTYNSQNIVLSSTGATSVNIVTAASGNVVSPATLTITASNQSVVYGSATATVTGAGTYAPSGFVNNETASVISGSITYTTNYTNTTAAGTAGVTITPVVAGLSATNYSFTPANGTITITAADVSVSSSNTDVSTLTLSPASNITVSGTGSLVINQNTEVASVAVAAGGKLTINSGRSLAGTVTLESTETSTATLLDEYTVPTLTATVKQHVSAGRNWYLSAPVSAADYSWLSRGTSVQEWNEASKAWVPVISGTLVKGKGYVQVATSSPAVTGTTGTVNVTGTTNSGDVAITVSRTESGSSRGFNLIGNPYPSYLKWSGTDGFITDAGNSGISTSFWYRTQNTSNAYVFTTYNGTSHLVVGGSSVNSVLNEYIPPMQAFWIRVDENIGKTTHNVNLTFKNTMRVHGVGDNNKFKAPKADERQLVRLQLANGVQSDEALIYFDAAAANTFDNYDSPKMLNNSSTLPDIYSTIGAERLAINGLNTVTDNMELPLGFTLKAATTGLKLKVSELTNFTSGTRVYLLDKEQNNQTELLPTTEYTFNTSVSTTNNESRFSLLFRAPGVSTGIDNLAKPDAKVFVNAANEITIIAPVKCNYVIYNAVGQQVTEGITTVNRTIANGINDSGVYVVRVYENGISNSTRVILNRK